MGVSESHKIRKNIRTGESRVVHLSKLSNWGVKPRVVLMNNAEVTFEAADVSELAVAVRTRYHWFLGDSETGGFWGNSGTRGGI